ncbi:translation initiation factor IF-3 [Rickettsia endosymbiont of Cardiosporidium cionae]|uniref:translation initiation factor IF-3 n=1 Tax=Rickettsia endosymbiont of Cardiosporidium cionae TaxID=2777155 RepID=UPI001892D5DE|nr:translation initiation factor IF-3 [Rickettsia endosymbiont of Cardiosporidium cionae]KAF8818939.1 translation initiation factor IF-3 [Rickettsia endosymbiont of Cardiosporidium cionae]
MVFYLWSYYYLFSKFNFKIEVLIVADTKKNEKFFRVNKSINSNVVRVIDNDGKMVGDLPIADAIARARQLGLDLIEIVPKSSPPVCKIADFIKYRYELRKRDNLAKKKRKKNVLKEMKFRVNIGVGDFDVKLLRIRHFLENGDKVRVSLWFKGREILHKERGYELFDKIVKELSDVSRLDHSSKIEGKQIYMLLSPISES